MSYTIRYEENPNYDDLTILGNGIADYAKEKKGHKPLQPFAFFVRDDANEIKGGINGVLIFGFIHIDQLWLSPNYRGKGIGTELMKRAEQFGKQNDCFYATVNTMDWEALDFYKRLGYDVEFERRGYLKDSIFYFLRKPLK